MSKNPITCLILKLEKGEVTDKKIAKELITRAQALDGHYRDPKKASRIAAEQLQRELDAETLGAETLDRAVTAARQSIEKSPEKQAKLLVTRHIGQKFEYEKNAIINTSLSPVYHTFESAGIDPTQLTKVQNQSLIKGLLGEATVKDRDLGRAVGAIKQAGLRARAHLRDAGSHLKNPPENTLPIAIADGKLVDITREEFIADMGSVDLDFLVENIPGFHKFKGGITEFLGLIYDIKRSGEGFFPEVREKYRISASDLLAIFESSAVVGNSDAFFKMQSKYGNPSMGIIGTVQQSVEKVARYGARRTAFGGSVRKYGEAIKSLVPEDEGINAKIELLSVRNYVDQNVKWVSGEFNQWAYRDKVVSFSLFGREIAFQPNKIFNFARSTATTMVNTGGVLGALTQDGRFAKRVADDLGMQYTGKFANFVSSTTKERRQLAARMALSIEYMSDRIADRTRFVQESSGSKLGDTIAKYSSSWSGLDYLTRLGRETNLFNIAHQMAELSDTPFNQLDEGILQAFRQAGIDEADWKRLGQINWSEGKAGRMMNPEEATQVDVGLGRRLSVFYEVLKEKGTPTQGIQKRIYQEQIRAGTSVLKAGLIDSTMIFQGFTSSVFENHLRPAALGENRGSFASLAGGLFVASIAKKTLENLSRGESTNYEDPKFYMEAFVDGGAFSIFGEVVSLHWDEWNKTEDFVGEKVLGVTLGSAIDFYRSFTKNAERLNKGQDTRLAYDLYKAADRYNPLNTTFYTKYLYQEFMQKPFRRLLNQEAARKSEGWKKKTLEKEGRTRLDLTE